MKDTESSVEGWMEMREKCVGSEGVWLCNALSHRHKKDDN